MSYHIKLRNGETISFTGQVNTTTCYGYVMVLEDGKASQVIRASEVVEIRKA